MNKAPDKYSHDNKCPVVVKLLFRCAVWFRLHHKIPSAVTRKINGQTGVKQNLSSDFGE